MKLRLTIALFSLSTLLFSQENTDSLQVDSIPQHSIKKAIIYSSVLPGAGQFYNYKAIPAGTKGRGNVFWKVPLFYAGIGATGYFLVNNQATLISLKHEYKDRANGLPSSALNPEWSDYDSTGIVTLYQRYATRRDLSILAFGAAYLFQIVDAGIGAHFVKFDISENLTMQIQPVLLNNTTAGLGFTFNFR